LCLQQQVHDLGFPRNLNEKLAVVFIADLSGTAAGLVFGFPGCELKTVRFFNQ
jgi:hypothetical protein